MEKYIFSLEQALKLALEDISENSNAYHSWAVEEQVEKLFEGQRSPAFLSEGQRSEEWIAWKNRQTR